MTDLDTALMTVDDQQAHPDPFPLVVGLRTAAATMSDVVTWIATERRRLIESLSLHGAVLFRGFPIHDANEFDAFIRAFALDSFTYEESLSNAVRVNCTELVFTANEAPPDVSIYLHHEMAQTPLFPSRLFFFCEKHRVSMVKHRSAGPMCCSSDWQNATRSLSRPAHALEYAIRM